MKLVKSLSLTVLILGLLAFATACAITDYDGIPNHDTQSEAKLWGKEIAFSGFGTEFDGTYSYNVKYDNRNGVYPNTIITYRNPVVASFSRDGLVDRDGDDIQGRGGILGGKFLTQWVYEDNAPGCQFFANQKTPKADPSKPGSSPLLGLCINGFAEEVDKDLDLQGSSSGSYGSLGDLFGAIWSGAKGEPMSANIVGLTFDGVSVPVAPVPVNFTHNGVRPMRVTVDMSGPNGQALMQAIRNNTVDGVPVRLSVQFEGGMSVPLPSSFTAVFDVD